MIKLNREIDTIYIAKPNQNIQAVIIDIVNVLATELKTEDRVATFQFS